jgi:hypothetical protein
MLDKEARLHLVGHFVFLSLLSKAKILAEN